MSKPIVILIVIVGAILVGTLGTWAYNRGGLARRAETLSEQFPGQPASAPLQSLSSGQQGTRSGSDPVECLPTGRKMTDVVSIDMNGKNKVTVADKLAELHAYCSTNKTLFAGNGKEVYFYNLIGCWGNPPEDYQEQLQRQDAEIRELQKRYEVIQMTCNPSGVPIS